MAKVYANANGAAAMHVETRREVRKQNRMVEVKATINLAQTDHTPRITGVNDPADAYFPAEIETAEGGVDCYTILHAPNAMALEFGHAPSGFFKDIPSKPPAAEYILTRAAHGGSTIG
jgi:hypothetical protein